MSSHEIVGIFPTPILIKEFSRNFTQKELAFLKKYSSDTIDNVGNTRTRQSYILEEDVLSDIKKECLNTLDLYIKNIYNPENELTPYITQSWLNYTKEKQYHHLHTHQNSFISGILYIDADPANDSVSFYRNNLNNFIRIYPKEFNHFNNESMRFSVKSGLIIIFPSNLTHSVEEKNGNNTRISLAFNSMFKGKIGLEYATNELIL